MNRCIDLRSTAGNIYTSNTAKSNRVPCTHTRSSSTRCNRTEDSHTCTFGMCNLAVADRRKTAADRRQFDFGAV